MIPSIFSPDKGVGDPPMIGLDVGKHVLGRSLGLVHGVVDGAAEVDPVDEEELPPPPRPLDREAVIPLVHYALLPAVPLEAVSPHGSVSCVISGGPK